ncbi:MAG: hypothetical protein GF349_04755 [Candidatus Magasanikbacteria bacterium]|nr:hypothetical protein [Candidatus Magasanikbacteria bacterium]
MEDEKANVIAFKKSKTEDDDTIEDIWQNSETLDQAFQRVMKPLIDERDALKEKNSELVELVEEKNRVIIDFSRENLFLKRQVLDTDLVRHTFHDINNLLTSIIGNGMMIPSCSKQQQTVKHVESVIFAAEQMGDLIRNVQDILHKGGTQKVSVDINDIIRRTAGMIRVKINLNLDPSRPYILMNKAEFFRIIYNLVQNAYDALTDEAGRIEISTAIFTKDESLNDIFADHNKKNVLITVKDNGRGMTKEVRQKIFDRSFTTKTIEKWKSGLGLTLVKQLVEASGGTISVNSLEGVGTSFYLQFPLIAMGKA